MKYEMYVPDHIIRVGRRRGLSGCTIKTYNQCVKQFFKHTDKDVREVTKKDVTDYLDGLVERGSCGNTLNVHLNAIKFLYEEILNKKLTTNIKYSKKPKRLPVFLTKEELLRMILVIPNDKHRLMFCLKYSTGIRVGELVKLRVSDLEIDNDYGWVRSGKGGKDRMFIIAEKIKPMLTDYLKKENLNDDNFIFKGRHGHITSQSFRMVVKDAMMNAKITKHITPHTLRHSFSTHIMQQGDDIVSLQSLLGHASTQTTMVYVHCAANKLINVKSPFDSLDIESMIGNVNKNKLV